MYMPKKILGLILSGFVLFNTSGCIFLLAGAAGGAGTAVWLSGKLTHEVNASLDRTTRAAKDALKSLRLNITKETVKEDLAQIIGDYTDGRTFWVDIRQVAEKSSKLEVRVGAITSDRAAADKILKRILRYL
ncbi:DUF3568 family protein [bacterium]|nr:MAG: DUF3568 family protein [bacterium]